MHRALRYHGIENFIFQIIEKDIPIENLNDKEIFYISKFKSNNQEYGYNLTPGGQLSHASYLTKDQVLEIIDKIKNSPEKTLTKIGKEYNVSQCVISDINNGDCWHFNDEQYPIRECKVRDLLSKNDVKIIKEMLRHGISTKNIVEKFRVSTTNITNINNGKIYKEKDEKYPIFKAFNSKCNLEMSVINEVINLLLTTKKNYNEIGAILNISRKTVSNINNGNGYVNVVKQLGYNSFPIRKEV